MFKFLKKILGLSLYPLFANKINRDCISGKSLNKWEIFVLGQVNTQDLVSEETWASSAGDKFFSCKEHLMTEEEYEADTIYRKPYMDLLIALIKENNVKTIVELGCGRGDNLGYISKSVSDVRLIGIDINSLALQLASTRWPDVEFISESITNVAEKTAISSPSLWFTCSVFMYLDNMTLRNLLRSFARGGWIAIVEPFPEDLKKLSDLHSFGSTYHDYVNIFLEEGFVAQHVTINPTHNKVRIINAIFEKM